MGNYIYYGYSSSRSTVTLEPSVKKEDTVASVVKEVSRPCCEIETIEKVIANTAHIVKVEQKVVEKLVEKEEVKVVEKVEVKAVEKVEEVKEVKVVEKVEVKVVEKVVDKVKEKTVIEFLKSAAKEKSPLLPPIKEESMDIHPYLLEYGTEPFKSDILLIQNEMYQPNKKKNKKKNQPNVFSEE